MKKLIIIFILSVSSTLFSGCLSSPLQGVLVTATQQNVHFSMPGGQIGDAQVMKKGESCAFGSYLFLFTFYGIGGSINDAMADGKITKIAVVDRKSLSILGTIFYRDCVVVWGE